MRRWWTSLLVLTALGLLWRATQSDPLAESLTRGRRIAEAEVETKSSGTIDEGHSDAGSSRDVAPGVVRPLALPAIRSDGGSRTLKLGAPVDPQAFQALVLSSSLEEPVLFDSLHCVVVLYFSPGEDQGADSNDMDRVVRRHLPEGHELSQSITIRMPVPSGRITVSPFSGSDSVADSVGSLHAVTELLRAAFE